MSAPDSKSSIPGRRMLTAGIVALLVLTSFAAVSGPALADDHDDDDDTEEEHDAVDEAQRDVTEFVKDEVSPPSYNPAGTVGNAVESVADNENADGDTQDGETLEEEWNRKTPNVDVPSHYGEEVTCA